MVMRYAIKPGSLLIFVTLVIILSTFGNTSAQTPASSNWGWGARNWGANDVNINVNRTININTTNTTNVINITGGSPQTTGFRQTADPVGAVNYDWKMRDVPGPNYWRSIASSSDGTKLIAASGCIYTSTDSGATWTLRMNAGQHYWKAVAASSDGTKLVAAESDSGGGYIYTSADSGATWILQTNAGQHYWKAVAASSDGTKLVAAESDSGGGYIYTSADSGATWIRHTDSGVLQWSSIASSSDGTKLIAVGGYTYTSMDSGATWTEQGEFGLTSVASSADGAKLVGADEFGNIYTSADYGVTWTWTWTQPMNSIPQMGSAASTSERTKYGDVIIIAPGIPTDFLRVACSSDGTKLVAAGYGYDENGNLVSGSIFYTSTDSGATWNQGDSTSGYWTAVAMSSDGTELLATEDGGSSLGVVSPGGYIYTSTDSGATWKQQTNAGGRHSWGTVASSFDGTKLIALDAQEMIPAYSSGDPAYTTYIYASTDSGATWKQPASSLYGQNWSAVASSSDGTKLVAASLGTPYASENCIFTSKDSGVTWTAQKNAGSRIWGGVASSSDGVKLVAVEYDTLDGDTGGYIYTSTNSGAAWIRRINAGIRSWTAVASSSDGRKLIAAADGGYIYTSSNSGATWTQHINAGIRSWTTVASSFDGTKLIAAETPGFIYTSVDSGATWQRRMSAGKRSWSAVTSSADGTRLVAAENGGYVYISADSGVTWAPQADAGIQSWQSLASSSDGSKLIATSPDFIWIGSGPAPKPLLIDNPFSSFVGASTASPGATIESNGGFPITTAGIAFGTSKNPDISGSRKITTATDGSFEVGLTGITPNTLYHFRGYAINAVAISYTDDAQFTTVSSAPKAKAASNLVSGGFTANWTAPPGTAAISNYKLDVARDPQFSYLDYTGLTVSGTSAPVTGLTSGKTYYYRVRAVNAGGTSANSNSVKVVLGKSNSLSNQTGLLNSGGSLSLGGVVHTIPAPVITVTSAGSSSYTMSGLQITCVNAGVASPYVSTMKVSAGPDQEVSELAVVDLNGSNSIDIDKSGSCLWTQLDGPPVAIANPNAVETSFIAPEAGVEGQSLRFQLTATETNGAKSTDDCIVNVVKDTAPPTADAGHDQTVAWSQIVVLDGSRSSASDAGSVSYSWRQVSGVPESLSDPSAAQPTFAASNIYSSGESLVFELTVTDLAGLRSRDTCIVNVVTVMRPPIAKTGPNRPVLPGSTVVLDGSGSMGEENRIVSYAWRQIAGPPVTLSDPSAIQPSFVAPLIDVEMEDLVFELTVTDSEGLQSKSEAVIAVARGTLAH